MTNIDRSAFSLIDYLKAKLDKKRKQVKDLELTINNLKRENRKLKKKEAEGK